MSDYELVNKYAYKSEQIRCSICIMHLRLYIFLSSKVNSTTAKASFYALYRDYVRLSSSIIFPVRDYNQDYFQACLDAMTEINFQMAELEKKYIESKDCQNKAKVCFRNVVSCISSFSGMKQTVFVVMTVIFMGVTLIKTLKSSFFNRFFRVIQISHDSGFEIVGIVIELIICMLIALILYQSFSALVQKVLIRKRVVREVQRETLFQILALFVSIFIAILI